MARTNEAAQNVDAEAAVLSAVVLAPERLDEVRDELDAEDFWLIQHRLVFEALVELDSVGSVIDVVTLCHQLEANGALSRIGGTAFVAQLVDATPSVGNVVGHARIVRRLGDLRRMRACLQGLLAQAQEPETTADVPAFLNQCEAEIFAAAAGRVDRETSGTLREVMDGTREALAPDREHRSRGNTTGLTELDTMTLGLVPGELWYVAGRPGQGKTALAMGLVAAAAKRHCHGVVFSLEMGRDELGERMTSAASGVGLSHLQRRQLSSAQWSQVMQATVDLARLPVIVDDGSQLTPSRLRSRVRRHASRLRSEHEQGKLGLVVVDYVQLMGPEANWRGLSRSDELERISRALKLLAKEFGVTVVALSQLNRGQRDRSDKRPTLADLRGSGALEQDADKVLFVHRDEVEGEERGETDLILAKGRNVSAGSVTVQWQPWCVRFLDLDEQAGFNYDDLENREEEPEL